MQWLLQYLPPVVMNIQFERESGREGEREGGRGRERERDFHSQTFPPTQAIEENTIVVMILHQRERKKDSALILLT